MIVATTMLAGCGGHGGGSFASSSSSTSIGTESVLWSFGGAGDGQNPYARLIMDSSGNLYGTTLNGGADTAGAVFKIGSSGTESVLWSFGGAGNGRNPYARLIMDSFGNVYGTTVNGGVNSAGTVFKISSSGTESVLWSFGGAGDGRDPYAGLVMDSSGNLYGTTANGGANSAGTVFRVKN